MAVASEGRVKTQELRTREGRRTRCALYTRAVQGEWIGVGVAARREDRGRHVGARTSTRDARVGRRLRDRLRVQRGVGCGIDIDPGACVGARQMRLQMPPADSPSKRYICSGRDVARPLDRRRATRSRQRIQVS